MENRTESRAEKIAGFFAIVAIAAVLVAFDYFVNGRAG